MSPVAEKEKLIEDLNRELGLTPYESKAYIAILLHGPLSPNGVNQKSGIPRPRTYDVLNGLVGKGLLMEQPGRPPLYRAVDPRIGVEKMLAELEQKTIRQIEEKRKAAEQVSQLLTELYFEPRKTSEEEEVVWVTRTDSAFIARFTEGIRNVKKEFASAVGSPRLIWTGGKIRDAIDYALKKQRTIKMMRPFSPQMSLEELEKYEGYLEMGVEVKHLPYEGLTFSVFDREYTVFWVPPYPYQVAVWMKLPPLAEIMHNYFETLWEKATPVQTVIRKIRSELHRKRNT